MLLALTVGGVVATSSCSTAFPNSDPGPTLPPLNSSPLTGDQSTEPPATTAVEGGAPEASASQTATPPTATLPPTTPPTTTLPPTTLPPTTLPPTTLPPTTLPVTTAASGGGGLVGGASAAIGGRSLRFGDACRQGSNVLLDGVTWSFAGNSFRLSGDDDVRSEAELIGDGWTMPMVVASVRSGVYTYVGTPVAGSVASAEVVIDHAALRTC